MTWIDSLSSCFLLFLYRKKAKLFFTIYYNIIVLKVSRYILYTSFLKFEYYSSLHIDQFAGFWNFRNHFLTCTYLFTCTFNVGTHFMCNVLYDINENFWVQVATSVYSMIYCHVLCVIYSANSKFKFKLYLLFLTYKKFCYI